MRRPSFRLPTAGFLVAFFCASSGAQTTWSGAVSSDWGAAGNWSAGVPLAGTSAVIPSGTSNGPSTAGVAGATCNSLTVNAGATLTIAPGFLLTANQHVTINGAVAGGGTLRMAGSTSGQITGSGPIGADLEFAKNAGVVAAIAVAVTVNGNLTLLSGTLQCSVGAGTTTVAGNAQFQGGLLQTFQTGTFDVAGNVTFSGTTVPGNSPNIRCAGNWTADAGYAPTSGLVVLDGAGAQTIAGTATFDDLTISAGSNTSTAGGLTTNGPLIVNGALTIAGALDANGSVTIGAAGALSLGSLTNTFAAGLTATGALLASGTFVFDGASTGTIVAAAALPSVHFAKSGATVISIQAGMTVNGNLTLTSGTLQCSVGAGTTAVSGNAQLQGGILQTFQTGTLDVAGDVTFSGTAVTGTTPTIRCAGNWTANAAYAPTTGSVVFDGSGPQTIAGTGVFPSLTISAGSTTSTALALSVLGSLVVNGTLTAASGAHDVNGPVTVSATGSLSLGIGTLNIGAALTANGSISAGTLVFDGPTGANVTATATLPNVQVSKTGAPLGFQGSLTVNGNLTLTAGTLQCSLGAGSVTTVSGDAHFQGGILTVFQTGTIDVAGDVTFSGATVTGTSPTFRCAGNWMSDAGYAPTTGVVELDGGAPTTFSHAAGGTFAATTLMIKNGLRTLVNDFTIAVTTLTIDSTGSLAVDGGRHLRIHRPTGATAFNVNGALGVATNSELSMGPQTTATVAGSLSLVGTAAQPATITGEAGGGYSLTVNGTLAARDFLVKEMGTGGFVIGLPATIAAAPNDFRNGTFDFRAGAAAGSVLLDVRRNVPAVLDQLTFLNTPAAAVVFNVKTSASSLPVSFTNWGGAFAGPSFESDPNGLITWNVQAAPVVAAFVVDPGAELAEVLWTMASQTGVASYQVRRATSAAGPFPVIASLGLAGPGYGFIDQPLPANQARFYLLYATLTGGESILLGSGSATPYSSAPPPNVYKVGPGAPFATIQAAINAAVDPHSVVWVLPGTYPSFSIGASAPSNLHILGEGASPVTISTSSGPIQISNVPASGGIELSNLVVGSAATAQDGIVITGCAAPIVLDELTVSSDGAHTAVQVVASPATAIQRSAIQGGTGLLVSAGSSVAISRGSLSSLVSTGSTIEMTSLAPGSVSVTPPASLITRTGLMPDIDLPDLVRLSFPSALIVDAFPNAPYIVIAAPRLGFTTVSPFEMPVLIDSTGMVQLPIDFTDASGQDVVGLEVPPDATLLGFTYVVQIGAFDASSNNWRFSNVETMVTLP
jgi:hypothetical protein